MLLKNIRKIIQKSLVFNKMNFYKAHKLAFRGNIPRMEDPDRRFYDPYAKKQPGDGQGMELNKPADEESNSSGFGTRVRGETFPDDFSSKEDYGTQRKNDIPTSDHMFMGENSERDDGMAPIGEGANDDRFVDYREKYIDITNREPVGPHNMQRYRTVIDRTRQKLNTEN